MRCHASGPGRLRLLPALLLAAAGCQEQADGPTAPSAGPAAAVAAGEALTFAQLSSGGRHTCGLLSDGRAYCWGSNTFGQLGDGTLTSRRVPTPVSEGLRYAQISAGTFHTCAVTTQNRAYCWGDNSSGQLGDGSFEPIRRTPTIVTDSRRFRSVNAGYNHTCAVTPADAGFCWGSNARGQLGNGGGIGTLPTSSSSIPVRVARGLAWRRISVGGHFSCGVTTDDRAYCWGENLFGQLGDGTRTRRPKPTAVAGGLSFRSVVAGGGGFADQQQTEIFETHACGVTTDDRAYCWGSGGALGDGTTETRLTPVAVLGNRRWSQVTASFTHSCGVTKASAAFCWGANGNGQLGDGTTTSRLRPTRVAGGSAFSGITAGVQGLHTCGRSTDGRSWCWGSNPHGQLGDGTVTNRLLPVLVGGGT